MWFWSVFACQSPWSEVVMVEGPEGTERTAFVTGGAIAVDGATSVATGGDSIFVQLPGGSPTELRLPAGWAPGQVAIVGHTALVVLRGLGSVLPVDLRRQELGEPVPVCAEPRGVAADERGDGAWIACRTGELAHVDGDGQVLESAWIDRDLRDVVSKDDILWVSRFRDAEVLRVDPSDFRVLDRHRPEGLTQTKSAYAGRFFYYEPRVAWRMIDDGEGGVALLHQQHQLDLVEQSITSPSPAYYGPPAPAQDPCGGIVVTEITRFTQDGDPVSLPPLPAAVAFDLALSQGDFVVAAMGAVGTEGGTVARVTGSGACLTLVDEELPIDPTGAAIAADSDGEIHLSPGIPFGGSHTFHTPGAVFIACASCHPDGGEDGHLWTLAEEGGQPRRTPSLAGGLSATAPFHWGGVHPTMESLWTTVGMGRMGHDATTLETVPETVAWLDQVVTPAPATAPDADRVEEGARLFGDPVVGCAECHTPPSYTDNHTYDVGTGGRFQVPSLRGVAARLPIVHDGCAETLLERFTDPVCGGGDAHGVTSHLSSEETAALAAYLETL